MSRPDNTDKRAYRLARALRRMQLGEDQPIANAAANMIETLLERLAQQEGTIQHLIVKRMEAEHGEPFGLPPFCDDDVKRDA